MRLPTLALLLGLLAPAVQAANAPDAMFRQGPPDAASELSAQGPRPPQPVPQNWVAQQSAQCMVAIAAAEKKYQTPPGLLNTIGKVESGRPVPPRGEIQAWPWSIDADNAALYLDSKAAALAWVRMAMARGVHSVDVGCMQVNLEAHPNAFRTLEDAFDPMINADYAARYLKQLHDSDAAGSWDVAVGYYHSHTPDLAASYRDRVAQVGAGILSGAMGEQTLFMRALRQGTLHLALAGGGMLVLNLNRQPTARAHRPMSACQVARILGDDLARPPRAGSCRTAAR